jgi:molybdopterin-containing oxidoreductase family iron-sulfur binding subunit
MSVIGERLDLGRLRVALTGGRGPAFWRSLDELADTAAFRAFVESEFPRLADRFAAAPDRRTVLKLLAASFAMGGLTACKKADHILPYVDKPADVVPGKALHYATTLVVGGYGFGAVVESHEGRPTKIEGNPDHPASLGSSDAIMQAACLALYDPERSRLPLKEGQPSDWGAFLADITALRAELAAAHGAGFAVVTGTITSPTQAWLIEQLRAAYPQMVVCRHDALEASGSDQVLAALFGAPTSMLPRFDRADVIVSLDDDFLGDGPAKLANARAFAARRIVRDGARSMARLYAVESTPTVTGAASDHRWAMRAGAVPSVAAALAARLGIGDGPPGTPLAGAELDAIAADLRAAAGRALVTAGRHQPAEVHQLAHAMNAALGAFGATVDYIPTPEYRPQGTLDLPALAERMATGSVSTLLMLGVNPAYDAPGDLAFAEAIRKLPRTIHLGLYVDATAKASRWHVPAVHDLERWGDARAFDGTASIVQPLVRPLYGGRAAEEILSALLGRYNFTPLEIVRDFWRSEGRLDDAAWTAAVQRGVVAGTATRRIVADAAPVIPKVPAAPPVGIEVRFVADPWLRSGEYSNNAWLQELPRPLSKIVWGNPALLAPATAARLDVATGDVITVGKGEARVALPVSVEPGHPEDAITLTLGFGQIDTGAVGKDVGTDVYPLRPAASPWMLADVAVARTGGRGRVITTQHHQSMEGRDIIRTGTLAEYLADPAFAEKPQSPAADDTLYPPWPYREEAWAMVIDQTACIGCMACVAACQAENNIPTVGADEVENGHEMHWLRVDRYYAGDIDRPAAAFQPVPCMQCEDAPCEVVCPVNATVHTHDGLNAQVYNRCVGTRYCSQNCPYKVRRFNFLDYQPYGEGSSSPLAALMNPDVSVRSRGVMEKCTYCVQRIERTRVDAQIADQPIADGAITPACAQACPTTAIVFGDKNDPASRVRRLKALPLNYELLGELNTRPRTTYLARLRNPNPAIAEAAEPANG